MRAAQNDDTMKSHRQKAIAAHMGNVTGVTSVPGSPDAVLSDGTKIDFKMTPVSGKFAREGFPGGLQVVDDRHDSPPELTPKRQREVLQKFENLRDKYKYPHEQRKALYGPQYPSFPAYQNLDVPKGCTLGKIALTNDNWVFLGKRYEVSFEFEIAFSTVRSREKKIASMNAKMTALLKLSSHTDLHEFPGITVKEWKGSDNV